MIALIDGDILTYRIGFAAQDSTEGIVRARVDSFMSDLLLYNADCDDFEGYLTGSGNFRHDVAVTAKYKGNRKAARPVHYDFIRDYLSSEWAFHMVEGQEADDAIGIEAYRRFSEGDLNYLICTIDKDLDMIPGKHYNFVKNIRYEVDEKQAIKWFYTQILTGDRIDNIMGLKGVGPVKAARIIEGARDESELYQRVVAAYAEHGETEERVIENGRLLWIRRREEETWSPPEQEGSL